MSSYVGAIVVGGFPPKKEVIAEDLRSQPLSSAMDPLLFLEQGKPQCMPILSYPSSFITLCLQCIVHLSVEFE
jgi:hypothetical protein